MKSIKYGLMIAGMATVAITGCGGSASNTPNTASQPPMASVIADQLGCTDVQAMDPTLYAYDEVTATCNGHNGVDIATFRTNQLRDNWIKVANQFTGMSGATYMRWSDLRVVMMNEAPTRWYIEALAEQPSSPFGDAEVDAATKEETS
jgi:hypothetical protein